MENLSELLVGMTGAGEETGDREDTLVSVQLVSVSSTFAIRSSWAAAWIGSRCSSGWRVRVYECEGNPGARRDGEHLAKREEREAESSAFRQQITCLFPVLQSLLRMCVCFGSGTA